jgi:tetratricopeptide (TPR) repeat protein
MASGLSQHQIGNVGPGASVVQGDNNSIGFSAAEVQQFVQAVRAGDAQQYTAQLIELAKQLGTTQDAVRTMLRIAGHDDVPPERWLDTLIAIATQYRSIRLTLSRSAGEGDEIAELRRRALVALEVGAFDEATARLNDIRARQRAASEEKRRRVEEARADWLAGLHSEADTCALLTSAALSMRDLIGAVAKFEDGLHVLAAADRPSRWLYALNAAGTLSDFGDRAGDSAALLAAIDINRRALADASRELVPLQWAATQNNLGVALVRLGERESGTATLEQAVSAFGAALQEWTREHAPVQWALAQTNLGTMLRILGERESGTKTLKDAVSTFREAMEEYTRERAPLNWAKLQNDLGVALSRLGERESGTATLEQAVSAFGAALQEWTASMPRSTGR